MTPPKRWPNEVLWAAEDVDTILRDIQRLGRDIQLVGKETGNLEVVILATDIREKAAIGLHRLTEARAGNYGRGVMSGTQNPGANRG